MEITWTGDLGNSGLKLCAFKNGRPGPVKRFYGNRCLAQGSRWLKQHRAVTIHAICANPGRARELKLALASKGIFLRIVKKHRPAGLSFRYDFNSLGADRLADIVAARADYAEPDLVVLDFGTALTVNVIEGHVFAGGFIVPGLSLMLDSLHRNAPALPAIFQKYAGPALARTTRDGMASGAYLLFVNGLTGLLVWILKTRKKDFRIIATGGGASLSKALPFPVTRDDSLTLRGVRRLMPR